MRSHLVAALVLGVAGPAGAQDGQSAAERARAFTLDLGDRPAAEPTPQPRVETRSAPVPVRPAPRPAAAPRAATAAVSRPVAVAAPQVSEVATGGSLYTLDTPIAQLIADARARVVLDRRLPGLSTDVNLAKFRTMGLRQFQPLTGGRLTDQMLGEVAGDLATIRPSTRRGVDR